MALAARYAIPAICPFRELCHRRGEMKYGPSLTDAFCPDRRLRRASYQGAKPSDLPITPPMKFERVINLKTAKARGFTILADRARAPTR